MMKLSEFAKEYHEELGHIATPTLYRLIYKYQDELLKKNILVIYHTPRRRKLFITDENRLLKFIESLKKTNHYKGETLCYSI